MMEAWVFCSRDCEGVVRRFLSSASHRVTFQSSQQVGSKSPFKDNPVTSLGVRQSSRGRIFEQFPEVQKLVQNVSINVTTW